MGDDKIVRFRGITKLDIDPNQVLAEAQGKLKGVVVIGFEQDADGTFYFASSYGDGGDVLWLLRSAELRLFNLDAQVDEKGGD